jgi:hypothetical protein
VNDPAFALGIPQGWPIFDRIIPDRGHQIGGIEKPVRRLIGDLAYAPAEVVEKHGSAGAGGLKRSNHRQVALADKSLKRLCVGWFARQHSREHDRVRRGIDEADCLLDRSSIRRSKPCEIWNGQGLMSTGRGHHVHGKVHVGRAGTAHLRRAERIDHHLADLIRSTDGRAEFGHRLQDRNGVHRLVHVLQRFGGANGTAQGHNRIAFGVGRREARHEIRNTGPRSGDRDPCFASHAANPARNERRILFVPTHDRFDLRIDQRIKNRIDLGAWDSPNVSDTLRFKGADNELGAGIRELIGVVLAEIGLKKALGFWQSEVEIDQRLHSQLQLGRGTVEEMSTMPTVLGDEMEMISRNAERTGEAGRPQTNERAVDIVEVKFSLRFCRLGEAHSFFRWTDRSGAHVRKAAVKPKRVKNVAGGPKAVALRLQGSEVRDRPSLHVDLWSKSSNDRKRSPGIRVGLRHTTAALNLIDAPIDDDHLSV